MRSVVLAAALLLCTRAASAGCSSAADCHLNGACSAGVCQCDPGWTGPACGLLDLAPIPTGSIGYGMAPNLTSWGGNLVHVGDTYHLYASEMVNHCPLSDWGKNSRCIHATSSSPLGPFTFHDEAVGVWCHNVQAVEVPEAEGGGYALFHIGSGSGGHPVNCTHTAPRASVPTLAEVRPGKPQAPEGAGSSVHVSSSPDGPWTPLSPAPPACNNPAPMVHPNGTWYLLCSSTQLYSAPAIKGPWAHIGGVSHAGGVSGSYEDAFMFLDARGNWHVIYHVYDAHTPCGACLGTLVSGHAFSKDGLSWLGSAVSPYPNVVKRQDGSEWTVSTRERPKLLFAPTSADGAMRPTHLVTGTCGGTATCPPTPGVNCKYNYWDFTLVQALH